MTAGPVNRALLDSFFQQPGDIYDDSKTEGALDVLADQVDENWGSQSSHRTAAIIDHPDGSVTNEKIADSTLTVDKFAPGALTNDTQNGLAITALKADYTKLISFTKDKKIIVFGDSYAQGSTILPNKLGGLLGEIITEATFYDYSVGGACMGNFGSTHNLTDQYNDMVSANVVPDIVVVMMGNNDANAQMLQMSLGSPANIVGTFSTSAPPPTTTTIGAMMDVIQKIVVLNATCKICIVPFFNLNQSSDGYFKLSATAIMTQLSILPFWKNVSILWQENFSSIDWNDVTFWSNAHPTTNYYRKILQPILAGWLRGGALNNPYPRKEFGLITSSTYDTTNYFTDIGTKINTMRSIGANSISANMAGDYSIISIGGTLDTVHVQLNSFYNDIYITYRDVNGMKWARYTTAGVLTLKGVNWV